MKRTLLLIIGGIVLLAVYKNQHVRPVDDPKDSPLFQQRLQSSLDRFQDSGTPARMERREDGSRVAQRSPEKPLSSRRTRDLVISGSCGKVTMTWLEEKKVDKERIQVSRRTQDGEYAPLQGEKIYEREEDGGVRYWILDSDLENGVQYEYLVSVAAAQDTRESRGPVSINLTCTERDRQLIAQREKMIEEYYQQRGMDDKKETAPPPTRQPRRAAMAQEPTITGRCGTITMTWFEGERVDKERIRISRRVQGGEYTPLGGMRIYDRDEDGGVRYWFSDSGLDNGVRYEYHISVGDDGESGSSRGPLAISLTCTEKDREILARQKQMIEEYYRKKGVTSHQAQVPVSGTSPYQLGSEVHEIDRSDSPHQGDGTLPVTVVVFTDFECIHCAAWAQTLHTIKRTFPSDVSIVFKNYPLSYHKRSEFAAKAALAAWEQGKFWEMHDLLFKNRGALGEKDILGYAENCGLDLPKFQQTLAGERIRKIIARDKLQGKALGVQNVPTSFINGRKLVGAPSVSLVEGMIRELLQGERDR